MSNEENAKDIIEKNTEQDDLRAQRIIQFVYRTKLFFRTKKDSKIFVLNPVNVSHMVDKFDHYQVHYRKTHKTDKYETFKTSTTPSEIQAQLADSAVKIWGFDDMPKEFHIDKSGGEIMASAEARHFERVNGDDLSNESNT